MDILALLKVGLAGGHAGNHFLYGWQHFHVNCFSTSLAYRQCNTAHLLTCCYESTHSFAQLNKRLQEATAHRKVVGSVHKPPDYPRSAHQRPSWPAAGGLNTSSFWLPGGCKVLPKQCLGRALHSIPCTLTSVGSRGSQKCWNLSLPSIYRCFGYYSQMWPRGAH